jgi:hypothetical protein
MEKLFEEHQNLFNVVELQNMNITLLSTQEAKQHLLGG